MGKYNHAQQMVARKQVSIIDAEPALDERFGRAVDRNSDPFSTRVPGAFSIQRVGADIDLAIGHRTSEFFLEMSNLTLADCIGLDR